MAEITEEQKKRAEAEVRKVEEIYAQCNRIDDPVRRGLCKVCGTPVRNMPFAQQQATCAIDPQGQAFAPSLSLTVNFSLSGI